MARHPTVRYFPSRGGYYCQRDGKQHRLAVGPEDAPTGPTYLSALQRFHDLMSAGAIAESRDATPLRALCDAYLTHTESRHAAGTHLRYVWSLQSFVTAYGSLPVGNLTHGHVYRWLELQHNWAESSRALALIHVQSVLNWAVRTGLITRNPLSGIDKPHFRSRADTCLITAEQHSAMLAECRSESFRRVLAALENTGARPGELRAAMGRDWSPDLGAIVFRADAVRRADQWRHKTARYRDRTIRFTGPTLEMVRRQVATRPTGYIFANRKGTQYAKDSIVDGVTTIAKRCGLPHVIPYSYRHTFATNWLLRGGSVDLLAELLGNSPATIRRHYSHLAAHHDGVRAALEAFHRK